MITRLLTFGGALGIWLGLIGPAAVGLMSSNDGARATSNAERAASARMNQLNVESPGAMLDLLPPTDVGVRDPGPRQAFYDGDWEVGVDVATGVYRTNGGQQCYWLLFAPGSSLEWPVIADSRHESPGPAIVELTEENPFFRSRGCGWWTSEQRHRSLHLESFGSGAYRVNRGISPGLYRASRSPGPSGWCVWERLQSFSSRFGSILGGHYSFAASGVSVVNISSQDEGFRSWGCGDWIPLEPTGWIPRPANGFGTGTVIVGREVFPGTYRAQTPTQDCKFGRLRHFGGDRFHSSTLSEDGSMFVRSVSIGVPRSAVVTIHSSDAGFWSSGCGTWRVVGASPGQEPLDSFGIGVFVVGHEIQPGRYRLESPTRYCFWIRLADFSWNSTTIVPTNPLASSGYDGTRHRVETHSEEDRESEGRILEVDIRPEDGGFLSYGDCGKWIRQADMLK